MNGLLEQLKGRTGALVAAGAAILTVALLFAYAIGQLLSFAEGDTDKELQALAVYHAEAASRPITQARLEQVLRAAATAPGLVQAASSALADAALESELKAIAKDSGAQVRSAEILPVEKVKNFEIDAIQYDLSVPMSRLRDLAYAVESHMPYLFIDHVTISAGLGYDPQAGANHDPDLSVRWTVRAYRWAGRP